MILASSSKIHDTGWMPDAAVVEWIQSKYETLAQDLDECARRRWARLNRCL
jgi:hypothetical protein